MKTLLRETLESLGYPVYLQGSMADDEAYPKSFITYLSMDSYNEADFDDKTHAVGWRFQVAFQTPLLRTFSGQCSPFSPPTSLYPFSHKVSFRDKSRRSIGT